MDSSINCLCLAAARWCLSCKDCWVTDKLARVQITFVALKATSAAAGGGGGVAATEGGGGDNNEALEDSMRVIDVQHRNFRGSNIYLYVDETPTIIALVRTLKECRVPYV